MNRLQFWWRYLRGNTPWDTGITPPEIVALADRLPPGRALDLGCGTGTSSLFLAGRGWQVTGIDYVATAIQRARRKARAAGLSAEFYVADVTHLEDMVRGPLDLTIDVGCLHSLTPAQQQMYAASLARVTRPGATYTLYCFAARELAGRVVGLTPEGVAHLFRPNFRIEQVVHGQDKGSGPASAWYWLRREPIS